jgi:hypothetical protein
VGCCLKRQPYGFKHTVKLAIDIVIAEPEYPVSKAPQSLIPQIVTPPVILKPMLMSIDLDHDSRAAALKVNDVLRDRRLTAKVVTDRAQFAKLDPELDLLPGHRFAQLARNIVGHEKSPPGRCAATLPFGEG